MLLSDTRIMASVLIGLIGLAFLLQAGLQRGPHVLWLAGSAVLSGVSQVLVRVLEFRGVIATPSAGVIGAIVGLVAWAAVIAGLQAFFRPEHARPLRVFLYGAGGAAVVVAAVHRLTSGWAFGGSLAVALLMIGSAGWLFTQWRQSRWPGLLMLVATFLAQPVLLAWAVSQGLDLQAFRQLTPFPLVVLFALLFTLILGRDATLLKRELRRRQQAEAELQALAASLEQKVRQRTQQLQDMVDGLTSFNSMVSHDLGGPLANTVSMASLAQQDLSQGHLDKVQRWLHLISRESGRAMTMLGDLLRLARMDQTPLVRAAVDLSALVEECVGALDLQYPHARQRVVQDGLSVVQGDAGMLRQVMLNLLSNALKFGQNKDGLKITVAARQQVGCWHIRVSDNGPGFDPRRIDELFKPFSRLSTNEVPGSGIGLTVVRRVVERHGGQVGAESTPGQGSTFWWTLPAPPDAPPRDTSEAPSVKRLETA